MLKTKEYEMKTSYNFLLTLSIILCCLNMSAQNLVNMDDWISGTSGATTNYSLQGTTSQNSRITMTGPYGNQATVWEASADGSSGLNGGFIHSGVVLDTDKTYRVSFWVRSTGTNNCTNFQGFIPYYTGGGQINPFAHENGGSTTWPYFARINQPNDQWFLIVGYMRPASANDLGDSGVYDPLQGTAPNLPSPSNSTTDFIFPTSVSQINFKMRAFMWTCGSGEKMYTYDPRIEEVTDATPLSNLLYGSSSNDGSGDTSGGGTSGGGTSEGSTVWTESSGNISYTSGNVGIGTDNPSSKLEILKNANLSNDITIPNSALIIRADNDGNDASLRLGVDNTNLKAVIQTQQTTTGEKFDLLFNPFGGNVGIGTTSPNYKLDVTGKINANDLIRVANPNNAISSVNLGWASNVARIRIAGEGSGANSGLDIQTTGDRSLMRLLHNGNVGIGTTTPSSQLHVKSQAGSYENLAKFEVADAPEDYLLIFNGTSAAEQFTPIIKGLHKSDNKPAVFLMGETDDNNDSGTNALIVFDARRPNQPIQNRPLFKWRNYTTEMMTMLANGNVGIGTITPDAKLTVNGQIHTKEVRVDLEGALVPDYVFLDDYNLKSLEEVQNYIQENGHLPNIPSAKEIEENGLLLKEMNLKLLEKIEELTLYTIQQESQIKNLNKLKKANEQLEYRMKSLEALVLKMTETNK